jgi:general secretion pathway protein D
MKCVQLGAASFLLLCAVTALADDPEIKQSSGVSSVGSERAADIRALLREIGARTHRQFVVDPRVPQLMDLGALDSKNISYPEVLAIFRVNGFAVVPEGSLLAVVPDVNATREPTPVVAPENIKALDDEWVTCIVVVRGGSSMQLLVSLRQLMPANATIVAIPDRNALIISDRAANVRRLVQLIGDIDKLKVSADLQQPKAP